MFVGDYAYFLYKKILEQVKGSQLNGMVFTNVKEE
jgi:hypothetical protein